jgi:hypothetical protein
VTHILVDGAPARITSCGYRRPGDRSPAYYTLADGSRLARREGMPGWLIARPGQPIASCDVRFTEVPGPVERYRAARLYAEACAEIDAEVQPWMRS